LDVELEELKVADPVWQRLSAHTQRAGQTPNGHDRETEPPPAATMPWTRTRDGSLSLPRTAGNGAFLTFNRAPVNAHNCPISAIRWVANKHCWEQPYPDELRLTTVACDLSRTAIVDPRREPWLHRASRV
jgi:hypothetical protein